MNSMLGLTSINIPVLYNVRSRSVKFIFNLLVCVHVHAGHKHTKFGSTLFSGVSQIHEVTNHYKTCRISSIKPNFLL